MFLRNNTRKNVTTSCFTRQEKDSSGLRGERFYGEVLMKAGGLGVPEKGYLFPAQLRRCQTLAKLEVGMGADLDTMLFISKKIKPCQPHREASSLTRHGNERKKNPVLFSAWNGRSKENCRFWSSHLDRKEDSFSLSYWVGNVSVDSCVERWSQPQICSIPSLTINISSPELRHNSTEK